MRWVLLGLEALLLTATAAAAEPKSDNVAPPIELLEFIGDWSAEEQKLIEKAARPKSRTARSSDGKSDDDDVPLRSGPPR